MKMKKKKLWIYGEKPNLIGIATTMIILMSGMINTEVCITNV